MRMAVCPSDWNVRSLWIGMAFPMWISGAVGSSPNFTLSGLLSFTDLLSFFVNSSFVTISTVPRRIISNCSSTSLNIVPPCYVSFAHIDYFLQTHIFTTNVHPLHPRQRGTDGCPPQ